MDLLVNNAGVNMPLPIQDITESNFDYLVSLDLRAYVMMMHYTARYMIDNGIKAQPPRGAGSGLLGATGGSGIDFPDTLYGESLRCGRRLLMALRGQTIVGIIRLAVPYKYDPQFGSPSFPSLLHRA